MSDRGNAADCSAWQEPFAEFARQLQTRLAANTHTTEDTIRYYFWIALMQYGADQHTMVPEMPHPTPSMRGKEIDLRLNAKPFGPAWLEVKYNRDMPSNQNQPRTQTYGALLTDFYKLALISDSAPKLVLYVSTSEMLKYLRKKARGLLDLVDEPFVLTQEGFHRLPTSACKVVLKKVVFQDQQPTIAIRVVAHDKIQDHEAFLFHVLSEANAAG